MEFINQYDSHELIRMGSSFYWLHSREGKCVLFGGPTSEWDIGAAQCVVEEGPSVLQADNNKRLTYNKENILNPFFIIYAWFYLNLSMIDFHNHIIPNLDWFQFN